MVAATSRFSIHGHHLRIRWSDALPREALETVFEYHGLHLTADGAATWTMTYDENVARPDSAVFVAEHESGLALWQGGGDYFIVHADAVLRISLRSGHISGQFPRSAGPAITPELYVAATLLLLLLLESEGYYAVHAACLVSPGGQGLLLIGPSDSGKSTMAMHLVAQGWHYLSDDSVLLFDAGDHVRVRALRRDFCVDPEAETLFPALGQSQDRMLTDAEKWRVRMDRLYPAQQVPDCRADALLFPQIAAEAPVSAVTRIRPFEAFTTMLPQAALLRRDDANAQQFTRLLQRLVSQAPAYRFSSGADVYRDGAQLHRHIQSILASHADLRAQTGASHD